MCVCVNLLVLFYCWYIVYKTDAFCSLQLIALGSRFTYLNSELLGTVFSFAHQFSFNYPGIRFYDWGSMSVLLLACCTLIFPTIGMLLIVRAIWTISFNWWASCSPGCVFISVKVNCLIFKIIKILDIRWAKCFVYASCLCITLCYFLQFCSVCCVPE